MVKGISGRTRTTSIVGSVLAAIMLAACGSSAGGGTNTSSSPTSGGSPTSASQSPSGTGVDWQAQVSDLYKGVGFVPPTPGAPPVQAGKKVWWISAGLDTDAPAEAAKAMQALGTKLGWDVTVFDGKGQTSEWLKGIDQAIAAKADGIIFWVIDCPSVQSGLEQAKAAGIPTVSIEGEDCSPGLYSHSVRFGASPGQDLTSFLRGWGESMATMAIAKTNAQTNVILVSETDLANTRATTDGWKSAFAKCSGCKIVDEVKFVYSDFGPTLQTRIEQAINQHPEANAIIPAYDAVMTAGGAAAVRASGRQGDLFVMGGEGSTPGMDQIRQGTGMQACSGLDPNYEVYAGVDSLIWLLGGKDPSATSNGEGLQLCDKDHNMPASGSFTSSYPYQDYYLKYWGVQN